MALVLVVGGVGAAKAIEFNHDVWRWVVTGPPLIAGAVLATNAATLRRRYETTMKHGGRLPVGRRSRTGAVELWVYALVALVAMADG